ncbi:unnamed protein product [Prorocentrum cordatum]|uniref:Uncharacterized protein n=1 Tax=Prorocentrum cordatum TaxID=2364126 RepID=A0ABN9R6K2_9DINO|nr:unnamed protein product [Polarella glacialis]
MSSCWSAKAVETDDGVKVFWSGHLTKGHADRRHAWLHEYSEAQLEIKASMPPFNNANKMDVPAFVEQFNVPTFGPNIANSVMRIFSNEAILRVAKQLGVVIPAYVLSTFVQDKMVKVHDMIRYARQTAAIADKNAGAIDKLERFVQAFKALDSKSVPDVASWQAFILEHVPAGWESRLHFDHLLENFGFAKEASDELRAAQFVKEDGETVTFEQHAYRWLSKAFSAYGPNGALTDVVNLVFAMSGASAKGLSDLDVARQIDQFTSKVMAGDLKGLWVPNKFFMDCEVDDCMCWALLQYIHETRGTTLHVLAQMPPDKELDVLEKRWAQLPGCEVWRDPDCRNAKAIRTGHGI